jgi:hypothetical protein
MHNLGAGNISESDHSEDQGQERIILKFNLGLYVVRNGYGRNWIRIVCSGGIWFQQFETSVSATNKLRILNNVRKALQMQYYYLFLDLMTFYQFHMLHRTG